MVFLKRKKWFVCTNIVLIKWDRCEAWFYFPFLWAEFTVWNPRGLLEGAKPKPTRQQERQLLFKVCCQVITVAPLRGQQHLHYCDVVRYLYNESIWQTNCEIRWCRLSWHARASSLASHIPVPAISSRRPRFCLCIEACVIWHCVHQSKSKITYLLKTSQSQP